MRIPAAIRGAKRAGAGADVNVPLIYYVNESYLNVAEKNILPRVHKESYLKRLKSRISSISPDARGVPLTDDSEGEGGSDTRKFRLPSSQLFHSFFRNSQIIFSLTIRRFSRELYGRNFWSRRFSSSSRHGC